MGVSFKVSALLLLAAVGLSACGRTPMTTGALPPAPLDTAKSVSPASVSAPPMVQTAILPPSVMTSIRIPRSAIQPVGWTQLPGGGIFVAASPDGTAWVLSSIGSGPDRSIWHYVNGSWTNIPGAATRMAVAPDNTLWVINSAGGIYAWNGSSWSTIAGGASDITVGVDGSVYVISSLGGGPYGRGIWRYTNGSWTQLPGAAVRIAASADTGTYPGGIVPGGFWVVNAIDATYYFNPSNGFNAISGGVVQVAPTKSGGLFGLGYLVNPDGSYPIYYNDLATGGWTQQPGAGTSIATDGLHVYVTGAAGGIYSAPVTPAAPLAVNPASLGFPKNSSYAAQTVTISGGAPPYTSSVADPTVAQASVSGSTLTVAPVYNTQAAQYNPGSTTVTVTDAVHGHVDVQVGVTTTTIVIQSR